MSPRNDRQVVFCKGVDEVPPGMPRDLGVGWWPAEVPDIRRHPERPSLDELADRPAPAGRPGVPAPEASDRSRVRSLLASGHRPCRGAGADGVMSVISPWCSGWADPVATWVASLVLSCDLCGRAGDLRPALSSVSQPPAGSGALRHVRRPDPVWVYDRRRGGSDMRAADRARSGAFRRAPVRRHRLP
jgi:hypothetical protein